jgi:hypothetical protein
MITVEDYQRAERDLTLREWRRGWRLHAVVYAIVMTGLTLLNVLLVAYTDADFFWFPFPLIGWDWPHDALPARGQVGGTRDHRTPGAGLGARRANPTLRAAAV